VGGLPDHHVILDAHFILPQGNFCYRFALEKEKRGTCLVLNFLQRTIKRLLAQPPV
jgi:hypothetical protein